MIIASTRLFTGLGDMFSDLGRLDEAEKMYQRALQGYEKTLGLETVKTYVPALNTTENLANLFRKADRFKEAEELYLRTIFGLESVYGHSNQRCQGVQEILNMLRDKSL